MPGLGARPGTRYESPTFAAGPIGDLFGDAASGQDGWQAGPRAPYSAAASPWALVTADRAASGSQSLQLAVDVNSNGSISAYRSLAPGATSLSALGTDGFGLSVRLYLDQAANSDLSWSIGLYDGYATLVGMTLLPNSRVMYGHRLMNTASTYTPGFDLSNTWLTLTIERDPAQPTGILLGITGRGQTWQQSVTSPGGSALGFFASGGVPTFPSNASHGVAYVDDLRLGYNLAAAVPEPGSWALLLAGGAGCWGWRRRQAGG